MGEKIRHWYIQKPEAHNCPLRENGAVFTEYQPTISERGCEWIRVYSADDVEKTIGMGLTRYAEVVKERDALRIELNKYKTLWDELQFIPWAELVESLRIKNEELMDKLDRLGGLTK